jgi:NADH:ubiquinone oxidoreductase subunit F (NADH-binding)
MVDVPLDFDSLSKVGSMLGSGAMLALSEEACMLDMALNAVRFFRNESCGKCVPCRVGSAKMVDVLTEIARGQGRREHLEMIDDLSHALMQASICGLGQVVPMPIRSVLTHFRAEVDDHLLHKRCAANVCPVRGV